jgi:hypothetical protein
MSFTNVTKPTQGDATKKSLADVLIDNDNDLNSRLNAIGTITGLKNGSFESDSDSDGTPDSWTKTLYSGGSFTLDTTDEQHSAKSAKFTSPGGGGNGGGFLDTTDFLEVSPNIFYRLYWEMKSSAAGVSNKVEVTFYDAAQASISTTTLYTSTANPTSWTAKNAGFKPPSTARFCKIRITGCHTASTTAGSTWFDNLWIAQGQWPFGFKNKVVFSATGTWTCPTGISQALVTAIGAGGGGGSTASGGGGGGGGTGRSFQAVTAGTPYTVTIGAAGAINGAGGNTSCNGVQGNGGAAGASGGAGGAGGSATGDETFTGTTGETFSAVSAAGGWATIEGGPASEGVGGPTNTAARQRRKSHHRILTYAQNYT